MLLQQINDLLRKVFDAILLIFKYRLYAIIWVFMGASYMYGIKAERREREFSFFRQMNFHKATFVQYNYGKETIDLASEIGRLSMRPVGVRFPLVNNSEMSSCSKDVAVLARSVMERAMSEANEIRIRISYTDKVSRISFGDIYVDDKPLAEIMVKELVAYKKGLKEESSDTWCGLLERYKGKVHIKEIKHNNYDI